MSSNESGKGYDNKDDFLIFFFFCRVALGPIEWCRVP